MSVALNSTTERQVVPVTLEKVAREATCDVAILSYLEGAPHDVHALGGIVGYRNSSVEQYLKANEIAVPENFDPPISDIYGQWGRKTYPKGFTIGRTVKEAEARFYSLVRQKGLFLVALGGNHDSAHAAVCLVNLSLPLGESVWGPNPRPYSHAQMVMARLVAQYSFSEGLQGESCHSGFVHAVDKMKSLQKASSVDNFTFAIQDALKKMGMSIVGVTACGENAGVQVHPETFLMASDEVFCRYIQFSEHGSNWMANVFLNTGLQTLQLTASMNHKPTSREETLIDAAFAMIWLQLSTFHARKRSFRF